MRSRARSYRGKPSRDGAEQILIGKQPLCFGKRQGFCTQLSETGDGYLPLQRLPCDFALRPARALRDAFERLVELGIQPDSQRGHGVPPRKTTSYSLACDVYAGTKSILRDSTSTDRKSV